RRPPHRFSRNAPDHPGADCGRVGPARARGLFRVTRMVRDVGAIIGLSTRDFVHELSLSTCAVLGIAAVLAPLLVLFGLKLGVVPGMRARLARDPRARALQPIGQGRFDAVWFAQLGALPQTGFVMPTTRFLAATVSLRNPRLPSGEPLAAELWPSGAGDPL